MPENSWENCYNDSWKDHIVPEAFQHPAKMAYGLLSRILTHAEEQGWLTSQSIILDCFGGISTTGILGAYKGYQVICVELEQKFVDLAEQNFKLHDNAWIEFSHPRPIIIQGDSRKLCELVESADIIVSSPPFQESGMGITKEAYNRQVITGTVHTHKKGAKLGIIDYGHTPGQLGSMKLGKVDMVISSPPYAESLKGDGTQSETAKESRDKRNTPGGSLGQSQRTQGYGSKENLGNLKVGDVDCFWKAAREILQQCHKILKPGGHAIFVTKDFVRKGKRVPFSDDWLKLCEAVGFKLVCRHRAMLVKEEVHNDLFGGQITKKTERKSFYRRLAEAKGSPKIDWEDVICMMKDLGE